MNRTDELTARLIDGTLTEAEAAELESLLASDPAARDRHVSLLEVEAALRGLRTDLDLGASTVARIEAERAERTAAAVMAGLADRPRPAWDRHRPRTRRRVPVALAALAAAVLVGVWLADAPGPVPPLEHVAPIRTDVARVVSMSGSVEVLDGGTPVALGPDGSIAPGQTIRTVGEESVVVVEFPDRTRIELNPETAVRFVSAEPGDASPRKLFLERGQMTAVVTDRGAVVGTGAAEVVARHGSFALWSSGPGSVRVELREGDVRVVRGASSDSVAPGGAAFVRDETTPVRVESPWRIDTTPRNEHEIRALDLAFSADGREVWAATAKQLVRWRVGPDGRGAGFDRELYASAASNDGHVAHLGRDLRTLVTCSVDDREDRVLVRDIPGGSVRCTIPVRVSEPRFGCVAPDASWVATLASKPGNRLRVWDAATGRERFARDLGGNTPFCLASTPDGRFLAVETSEPGKKGNKLTFLDAATGEPSFSLPTQRRPVTAVAFSPDGRVMVAGFNGAVQLWDVPGRKLLRTIEGFERAVSRLAYDPGSELIAAGTQDGQVWVWSARTGRRTQVIQTGVRGVRAVVFSPDGRTLATATSKAPVALWDVTPEPADQDPDL